jgi:hypothetical protein
MGQARVASLIVGGVDILSIVTKSHPLTRMICILIAWGT